jgi:hypothetical protein
VTSFFTEENIDRPKGVEYYLGCDHLLFREGSLADCGISDGRSVALYPMGKSAAANRREGIWFLFGGLLPLLIGLTCVIFAVSSSSEVSDAKSYNGLFLFVGILLLIPGAVAFSVGLILIPECPMPCYFSGTDWW